MAAATEAVMASATSDLGAQSFTSLKNNNSNNSTNNNNNNNHPSNGGSNKMLPSFSDILWCPDIDGDMTMSDTNIGGAMVRNFLNF